MLRPSIFFRTRSPERDSQTDATRREAIAAVIERQRDAAQRELEGLSARMSEAYDRAAALMEATAYADRPHQDEKALRDSELSAEAARRRIEVLKAEMALFDELLGRLGHSSAKSEMRQPEETSK